MPRLPRVPFDALEPATREALAPIAARGPLADVWLEFASSEPALRAYLGMEAALEAGALEPREIEAIKLRVSAVNRCEFCFATHRAKARRVGLSSEAIAAIRDGAPVGDARLDAMLAIVNGLFASPGTVPDALIRGARDAGVSDAALMDLCMAAAAIFFTNVANHVNATAAPSP